METPDFNAIRQVNVYGVEFWYARQLMPLLGYGTNWRNFTTAIEKAKTACEEAGQIVADHFDASVKMVTVGSGGIRPVEDYRLSRLGCYLVAMNGNPRKPEVAAAQQYFAVSTRKNEMRERYEEQQARLVARLKVAESYKALAAAASIAGVESEFFGIFIDYGYLGLARHTRAELQVMKDIPENEEYLNNITREELSAIDFKNVLTEAKLLNEQIFGNEDAAQAHYFVGDQVRKTIEAIHGPMPEDLPSAPSIRKMVEESYRRAKKLREAKQQQQENGQGLLFEEGNGENHEETL